MRGSTEKLRWLFLGGALLLAAVVAAFFGLANYRAGKVWQRILARNGVNLQRESNGITISKSERGRTIFTIHAAKSLPHGNGQWTLRDAVLILYGKDGRDDRISGNQFEYNETAGVLRAVGQVHLDLQAPQPKGGSHPPEMGLTFAPEDETALDPGLIHVLTSGLVYTRKTGLASTEQMAEFRYKGMTCTSVGAAFDSAHDTLRLLSDVHLGGTFRTAPFTLLSSQATLDRGGNTMEFSAPRLTSGRRAASSEHALIHLHKDGSLETGDADGDVQLRSTTQTIAAPRLHADFGTDNVIQHAALTGGVVFADSNTARNSSGAAQAVDLSMNTAGLLTTAVATGGARFAMREAAAAGASSREMQAQKVTASFVPETGNAKRSALHKLQMTGDARMTAQSSPRQAGQTATLTRVGADDLTTMFSAGAGSRPAPQHMQGTGHTSFDDTSATGARQASTGDALQMDFAQRLGTGAGAQASTVEVTSAVQDGHVVLHSWPVPKKGTDAGAGEPTNGRGARAVYTAAQGTLVLTAPGANPVELDSQQGQLRAPMVTLHQGTGDVEASGGVSATEVGQGSAPATHVLADRASLLHEAGLSEFFGTDLRPAQLFQGGSQVRAAKITLDGQHHRLSARPDAPGATVSAVFASARDGAVSQTKEPSSKPASQKRASTGPLGGQTRAPEGSRDAVEVRAAGMDYSDAEHEATFTGGVTMRGPEGEVQGMRGAAFLIAPTDSENRAGAHAPGISAGQAAPPDLSGRLDRLAILGNVRLTQPGRTGMGEQLTYTAATNSYALTGTPADPPRVHDEQQGWVTGAMLVFGAADSSIVVTGTQHAEKATKPARVHVETDIEQH